LVAALAIAIGGFPAGAQSGSIGLDGSSAEVGAIPQEVQEHTAALPGSRGATGVSRAELEALIDRMASRHGVERALVRAVVAAESAFDAQAVSRAGAVGLMQVMPATAVDYGVTRRDALFDPKVNVATGIRHLKRLLGKYGDDYGRVIMAYNAGEGVVDRTNSNVTYIETLNYTEAVIRHYRKNGGSRSMDQTLQKVRALRGVASTRRARSALDAYLDPSIVRNGGGSVVASHRINSSMYPELADGDLDRALSTDSLHGELDDLPQGDF
jgi:hypothetical protein